MQPAYSDYTEVSDLELSVCFRMSHLYGAKGGPSAAFILTPGPRQESCKGCKLVSVMLREPHASVLIHLTLTGHRL